MATHRIPSHLREGSQTWLEGVRDDREWSTTQWRVLMLAAEAFDRAQTARRTMEREGLTTSAPVLNRKGEVIEVDGAVMIKITAHPAASIARDNATLFAKLIGQLGLAEGGVLAGGEDDEEEAPSSFLDKLAARRAAEG